ncbi:MULTISPECIES: universal stress protein [Sphingomonadaceae]|jgi:nucleotide-binding universal stress UspA family protein|uniref:UspA domain-containing protein n=7 Tax=Sphingomonadaceae TaxID=41297 RepID=F6ESX6_SPHCR|nr:MULTISPECIES: universal stress protein [Sphingomonadaceae]KEQ55557.1 UspA domain-containing protein [Sphingobium chlorophenolicum]BAV63418.1 UspA domain-containing protein [Sphingobium cloacae]AEG48592.1 UspA domain-containing protein [Sphingobium chlorophenolicum L-1]AMG72970.1 UspA domain-containing protein [Sphingopyxis granuli]AMK18138.1 UspA domain-containing protein [Sphingobium sp. MI1205]
MSAVSAFPSFSQPRMSAKTSGVVACIDCTDRNAWIYPHALALASTLDVPVTLLQVLDRDASPDARPDPIECNLRRREAMRVLDRCAATIEPSSSQTTIELAEGPAAEEICRYVRECDEGMVVLGRRGRKEAGRDGVGGTVHKVLSQAPGPVLLVPVEAPVPGSAYRRIVVPLDGSRWAESVLPLAVRLAKAADAELLLVHVVPTPEMIQARPLETEDETLRENLIERNEQAARSYLDRTRSNLSAMGLRARAIVIRGGDVRDTLCALIDREAADLAVMSARGHGHQHVRDVPYGTVASYLMAHCSVPMLVLPSASRKAQMTSPAASQSVRLPTAIQV